MTTIVSAGGRRGLTRRSQRGLAASIRADSRIRRCHRNAARICSSIVSYVAADSAEKRRASHIAAGWPCLKCSRLPYCVPAARYR